MPDFKLDPKQRAELDNNIKGLISKGATQEDVTKYASDYVKFLSEKKNNVQSQPVSQPSSQQPIQQSVQPAQKSGAFSVSSSPSKSRLTYQGIGNVLAEAAQAQDAYSKFEQKYSSYGAGRVASADAPDFDQKKKLKADLDQKKAAEAQVLKEYGSEIDRVWKTVVEKGKTNLFFNGDVFDEGKGRKFINEYLAKYGGGESGRLKEYMLSRMRNSLTEEKIKPEVNKITGGELAARGVKFNPETNEYEYKGIKYSPNTAAVSIATRKGAKDVEEYKVFSSEAKKRSESALTIAKNEATQLATSIGQLAEQTQKRIDAGEISVEEGKRILSNQYEIVSSKIKTINSRYTETVARLNSENRKRYSSLNKNLQTITQAVTPEELDAEMPADLRKQIMDAQKSAYQKYYKSKNIQRQVGDIVSSGSFYAPGGKIGNLPATVFAKGAGSSFLNFVSNVADGFIADGYNNKFLDWASSLSSTAEEISPGEYSFRENPGLKLAEVSGQAVGGTVPSLTLGFILSRVGLSGTAATLLTGAFDAYTSAKSSKGEQYSSRVGIVAPSEAKRESDEVFGKIIAAAPLYAAGGLGDFINVAKKGLTTKAAGKIIDMSAEASTSVVEEYAKYEASGGKDSISKFIEDNPQIVGEAMIGEVILSSSFSGIGKVFSAINTKAPAAFNQHIFNSVSEIGPEATVGIINKYYEQGIIDKKQLSFMLAEVDKVSNFKLKMEAAGVSEDKGQLLSGLSEIERDLKVQFESEQDAAVKAVLQKKLTAVREDISGLVEDKTPFMTFTLPGGVEMKKSMTVREFNELSVDEQNEMIKTADGIRVVGDDLLQTDVTSRKAQLGNNPEAEGAYTQTPMQQDIEKQREDIERRRQEELQAISSEVDGMTEEQQKDTSFGRIERRLAVNAKYDAELAALSTTRPEVSKIEEINIDKGSIASNAKTETETIKALPVEEENGATLNIDGTKYTGEGLVIPVASKNTTQAELTPEMLADFIEEHKGKLSNGQSFKVGYYKFPGSDQVSIDLNIVVDPKNREAGLEFGRLAGQESLFDLGTFENIKTGADGSNPRSFSDAEFADIANSLNEGRLPSFMQEKSTTVKQMAEELRGTRSGTKVAQSLASSGVKVRRLPAKEFAASTANAQESDYGYFNSETGEVILNDDVADDLTEIHEGAHPVMNIIYNSNRKLYDQVVSGMKEAAKTNAGVKKAVDRGVRNYDGQAVQDNEGIVETIAMVGTGEIDLNSLPKSFKQKMIDLVNSIAKAFGFNQVLSDTDVESFRKLATQVADALVTGKDITGVVGEENISNWVNNIGLPDVVQSGQFSIQQRVTEGPALNVYESKESSNLPQRSIADIHEAFGGKAVVINSDPTRVGELTLLSGKKIFMYGGPGYLSIKDNIDGNIGFATTQLSKVNSWGKYVKDLFGEDRGVTLIATQTPMSMMSNSYALRYVMDAISQLPKSVLRSSEFKSEFFGKDLGLLKNAFGDKAYKEFVDKYRKADLSSPEVIDGMIEEMAYKVGDDNKPASFKARGAFVSNLLGGVVQKSARKGMEEQSGYISKMPSKFISSQLMNRFGLNQEKLFYELGEKSIVDLFMNEGKWGMAVAGFESDLNIDLQSVQAGGVKHPLFNAKFPGVNAFILDGAYELNSLFTPIELVAKKGTYVKNAAQMAAGSMYVKGTPTQTESSFEFKTAEPAGPRIQMRKTDLVEDAGLRKMMTEDGGDYVFFHYSGRELRTIDPSKFGKNLATGRDEKPGVGISMYYTRPDQIEANVPDDYGYTVRIPKNKVYPFNEDPLNLLPKAEKAFNKDYPGQAFDANKQLGYVTKIAAENGYPMTVAQWNIKGKKALRAQTTEKMPAKKYREIDTRYSNVYKYKEEFKPNAKRRDIQFRSDDNFKLAEFVIRQRANERTDAEIREAILDVYPSMSKKRLDELFADPEGYANRPQPKDTKGLKKAIKDASDTKSRDKVTMSELAALKKQMKDFERGLRSGMQEGFNTAKNEQSRVERMKEFLRDRVTNIINKAADAGAFTGEVRGRVLAAVVKKINAATSPVGMLRFTEYLSKVMQDVEYDAKLQKANSVKASIKKALKRKDKNASTKAVIAEFAKIDPALVEDVELYTALAEQVLSVAKGVRVTGGATVTISNEQFEVDNDTIEAYTDDYNQRREDAARQNIIDTYSDLVDAGVIDPATMSTEDMEFIIESIYGDETDLDTVDKKEQKVEALKSVVENHRLALNAIERYEPDFFDGITEEERIILENIKELDLNNLDLKQLAKVNDVLNEILVNKSFTGAGEIAMMNESAKAIDAAKAVAKDAKFGSVDNMFAKGLASIQLLNDFIFRSSRKAAMIQEKLGIVDLFSGYTRASKIQEQVVKEYLDLKKGMKDADSAYNRYVRGVLADVMNNFGGTDTDIAAEFDRRKNWIKQTYERLKGSTVEVEQQEGVIIEQVYNDILADAESVDDVLSKVDDNNIKLVDFWRQRFAERTSATVENAALYNNRIVEAVENYTSTSLRGFNKGAGVRGRDMMDAFEATFLSKKISQKESGTKRKKVRSPFPPPGSVLDLDFDNVQSKRFYEANFDIETSKAVVKLKQVMAHPDFASIFGSAANAKVVSDAIVSAYRIQSGTTPPVAEWERTLVKNANILQAKGVRIALGSVAQLINQYPSVALGTIFNLGADASLYFKALTIPNNLELFDRFLIGMRGGTQAGFNKEVDYGEIDRAVIGGSYEKIRSSLDSTSKKLSDLAMSALTKSDVSVARTSWLAYYMKSLRDQGIDISTIDWESEHNSPNSEAASYAEQMVSRAQNPNDPSSMGALYRDRGTMISLIRNIAAPFSSFSVNQRVRMTNDMQKILFGDKKAKVEGGRSLAAAAGEIATFNAVKVFLWSSLTTLGATSLAELVGLLGGDDEDEVAKEMAENDKEFKDKYSEVTVGGVTMSDKTKKFVSQSMSDFLFSGMGSAPQEWLQQGSNYLYSKSVKETLKDGTENPKPSLFYTPGNKGFSWRSFGTAGIAPEKIGQMIDAAKRINTGVDYYVREGLKSESVGMVELTPAEKRAYAITMVVDGLSILGIGDAQLSIINQKMKSIADKQIEYKYGGKEYKNLSEGKDSDAIDRVKQ